MLRRPCVLAFVCLAATVAQVRAQATDSPRARSGVVQNGHFFGFVPKHERVLKNRNVHMPQVESATTSTELATRPPKPVTKPSAVQQASYTETISEDVGIIVDSPCECGGDCQGACRGPKLWGSAEYLYWWTNGAETPALATTSPADTLQTDAGVLPDATILFGGDDIHDDGESGGRFSLGMWLNPQQTTSLQVSYLFLADDESFAATGTDFPILARPFFNVTLDEEDSRLIEFEDLVTGNLSVNASTDFGAFEILLRRSRYRGFGNSRAEFLFGYRRANLDDVIRIDELTTSLAAPSLDTQFDLFDQFETENEFHGGQVGIAFSGPTMNCWSMNLLAKVAFGNTTSRVAVSGQTTTTTAAGDTSTANAGLLAQDSNIGSTFDDEFSTLSEFGVSLQRQLVGGLSLSIGYTFLHWSDVARAAEQIDVRINQTQIPPGTLVGDALPAVPFNRSDFWAQGLNFGLEYRF